MKRFLIIFVGMAAALLAAEWIQGVLLTAAYVPGGNTVEMAMWVRLGISALCVTGVYLLMDKFGRRRASA
ncbi:hypothetical protein C772_01075 [Bhargavaea cecembensis DSE10]|uniref:Uncharacterized protein n=1 Tax=Bhargavaea cecembensis DSE10 TaxID=1235279 RepID=M7P8V5_9BACL|nr:hypothetical protein [Bhargavaea cecembensis]EMR06939.1 hypothetical protein C772_01075 [Bhargavaea cecembensis DSE10]